MSGSTISGLPPITDPLEIQALAPVVQGGQTRKATVSELATAMGFAVGVDFNSRAAKSANLSDLVSASAARSNLGLGALDVSAPGVLGINAGVVVQPVNAQHATLTFGNGWQFGQDSASNGTKDFFLYQGLTGFLPMLWDTAGRRQDFCRWDRTDGPANSYEKVLWTQNILGGIGINAPGRGTTTVFRAECQIGEIADAGNGTNSESTVSYQVTYARADRAQRAWNIWGADHIVYDARGGDVIGGVTRDTPTYFVGHSLRVHAFNDLRAKTGGQHGSYGMALTTRPFDAGETADTSSGSRAGWSTQPMNALLSLSGFSGLNGGTITSGTDPGAGSAADFALLIGGGGGSIYLADDARSKFGTGVGICDYTTSGLYVQQPLAGYEETGIPVLIAPGGAPSRWGDTAASASNATLILGQRAAGESPLALVGVLPEGDANSRTADVVRDAFGYLRYAGSTVGGAALVRLGHISPAAGDASAEASLPAGYTAWELDIAYLVPTASAPLTCQVSLDNGATWITSGYMIGGMDSRGTLTDSSGATAILSHSIYAGAPVSGRLTIKCQPGLVLMTGALAGQYSATALATAQFSNSVAAATAPTRVRFGFSATTFAASSGQARITLSGVV
ncbi:hypothetical protein [Rhodovarius lipocyclicus]|uniref:hypothetical protein n=1 Tax=Rhodovarius lipocyclicus TaxID=268410 RepID=UPI0013568936|nr:hypothetical protein [Rhodovarius lipocyclicus]